MSEASGDTGHAQLERSLIERNIEDEAVKQELGMLLPEEVRMVAVEETQDTIYFVLPGASPLGADGGELSDLEPDAVAGGGTWVDATCQGCIPYDGQDGGIEP